MDRSVSILSHLLCDGHTDKIVATDCFFANITWGTSISATAKPTYALHYDAIDGCSFNSVSNGIDGLLFTTTKLGQMVIHNSTFTHCNGNFPTERLAYATGQVEMRFCTKISIQTAGDVSGGALLISGEAAVQISRCFFDRCGAGGSNNSGVGFGGAFYAGGSGVSAVIDTNFTNCFAGYIGGCLYHSTITYITNRAVNHGGVFVTYTGSHPILILDCLFKGNQAGTNCGIAFVSTSLDTSQIWWKFCIYESCSAALKSSGTTYWTMYQGLVGPEYFVETYSINMGGTWLYSERSGFGAVGDVQR